ncbi:zinc ribbon domain-containing protein [Halostagnicola sp. A-GB9-2]|uniref:zinc ribbon domain-containing protein n=1 Tax=Halostagnicola sp. A-GB9-2 TaxID=3048066 RepID=UPI0024BF668D|nr:zinc ribbon domain-containing protein [Halostagnicola sp. A-GB9-2]MDJ1434727.1 zinc ribbon domain-containing protein [Halostagnicola sp. A-GB9-2]
MHNADRTAIGVDLGEYNLYTASPVKMPDSSGAHTICGEEICARLDELRDRVTALLYEGADRETIVASVTRRRDGLLEEIDAAAREICEYANAYDRPVLVTEDSHYQPDLWTWLTAPNAHRGTAWLLPTAHLRLRAVADECGLEVATVPEAYSSQECHACGVIGDRPDGETFRCTNPHCHVETLCADYNAAKVLARRYYPGRRCAYRPPHSVSRGEPPTLVAERRSQRLQRPP